MMQYAGLTDDPARRKAEHGNPADWSQQSFDTERQAREWEKIIQDLGCQGDTGGKGWRYGYTYTITSTTKERTSS